MHEKARETSQTLKYARGSQLGNYFEICTIPTCRHETKSKTIPTCRHGTSRKLSPKRHFFALKLENRPSGAKSVQQPRDGPGNTSNTSGGTNVSC